MLESEIGERLEIWIIRVFGGRRETGNTFYTYGVGRDRETAEDRAYENLYNIGDNYQSTGITDEFMYTENGWMRMD